MMMNDITRYGAVADGVTVNTAAIQKAIDECPVGGAVLIPKGTFVSGALFLKSDMTLMLADGAVLLGSSDLSDYPVIPYEYEGRYEDCFASLINTRPGRQRNISIVGRGRIDANGVALFQQAIPRLPVKRGRAIMIRYTENLRIEGVTICQSPAWCLHIYYCRGVKIHGIALYNMYSPEGVRYEGVYNADGIDLDSCVDCEVTGCMISSEDDCIAIKSGRDAYGRFLGRPSENILIENCTFKNGFGVAMGSEMSGGVRNVVVRNCAFVDSFSVASVKCPRGRGSAIEDILYENCVLYNRDEEFHDSKWFRGALYVDNFYSIDTFDTKEKMPVDDSTPAIRDITFRNIEVDTVGGNAIWLAGLPEMPLERIVLDNVKAKGITGFIAANVRGLILRNVTVECQEGPVETFENVTGLVRE